MQSAGAGLFGSLRVVYGLDLKGYDKTFSLGKSVQRTIQSETNHNSVWKPYNSTTDYVNFQRISFDMDLGRKREYLQITTNDIHIYRFHRMYD